MSAAIGPIPLMTEMALSARLDEGTLLDYAGVIRRSGRTGPLIGVVENKGSANLVLSVRESLDNGVADLYEDQAATGLVTLGGNPSDTHRFTVSDGTTSVTFEFDNNSSVTGGNIAVTIGGDAAASLAALKTAINAHAFNITASDGLVGDPANTLRLTNDNAGAAGNVAMSKTGASISVTGMSGGTSNTVTLRHNGADVSSITVPPMSKTVFLIEEAQLPGLLSYLKFFALPTKGTIGRILLLNVSGELVLREQVGTA